MPPDAVMSASGKLSSPNDHGPAVDDVDEPAAPGHDADREPAAEDLAVRGEVRPEVEQTLDATLVGAEAGDDLVEHEQEAVLVGEPAQLAQELDRLEVGVPGPDRLDEDEREVVGVGPDDLQRPVGAVLEDEGVVDDALGDARHHRHGPQLAAQRRPPARARCRCGRGCRR